MEREGWREREREREMLIRDLATPAAQSPNNLAKIRSQEGHQEQDEGGAEEDGFRRGERRVGAEMGIQGREQSWRE
jgi:hypothetical protein